MKTKLPKKITICFTEKDRLKASHFSCHSSCLLATALKRMGFKEISEEYDRTRIGGIVYLHPDFGNTASHYDPLTKCRPYYGEEVVGKTITLIKREPTA